MEVSTGGKDSHIEWREHDMKLVASWKCKILVDIGRESGLDRKDFFARAETIIFLTKLR